MRSNIDKENRKKDFIKRLIRFSLSVIRLCDKIRGDTLFRSIIDQVIRSATSVGANVVEAQASSSRKDYIKFFQIALKSTNETIYWLLIIKESKKELSTEINALIEECKEIGCILGSSLLTLKGKRSI
jgi:four helix bundle protein